MLSASVNIQNKAECQQEETSSVFQAPYCNWTSNN